MLLTGTMTFDIISKILPLFSILGIIFCILGAIGFVFSLGDEFDSEGVPKAIRNIFYGVLLSLVSPIFKKIFPQNPSEEVSNQVSENTVETFTNTIEVTNDSGNIIGILIAFLVIMLVLVALLLYIEHKIGFKNLFPSDDKKPIEEETTNIYTLEEFNKFIRTTSGEVKKKCEWIARTIQFLESKGKDTSKFYSYYLPELIHILEQSNEVSPAYDILNTSNQDVTKIQLDAIQTVIDELNQRLRDFIDKEMIEVECNASVMKTVSHLD